MNKDYSEKLKDPRWQRKRLEILERDGWACSVCINSKETLHVHHWEYTTEDPWDEEGKNLNAVCKECHERLHNDPHFKKVVAFLEFLLKRAHERREDEVSWMEREMYACFVANGIQSLRARPDSIVWGESSRDDETKKIRSFWDDRTGEFGYALPDAKIDGEWRDEIAGA